MAMIEQQDLRELVDFTGEGVVSLYLNTDLSRESKEKCRLVLREQLGRIDGKAAPEDLKRIESFFDFEYDWQGKSVALFSCQAQEFWRVYSLPVLVTEGAFVGSRPHVRFLANLADKFDSYGMVIVDREDMRMFHIRGGRVLGESEVSGEEVKHHKQGGWAQARYQRWVEGQAVQNLKQAARDVATFLKQEGCERLILGGTEENVAQFKELLPRDVQERVVGTLAVGRTTSVDEILERSWEIMPGLTDTLYRLHEGRVRILILLEDFSAPGYACSSCGYAAAEEMPKCLFCGSTDIEAVADVTDYAVHKAIEMGVAVRTVAENKLLQEAGGIGAVLHY